MKTAFIHIMTNFVNTTLYTGVTANLLGRVWEHKHGALAGFTRQYNLKKLVYFEGFDDIRLAIAREKQIKRGSRAKKDALVQAMNPYWHDLAEQWYE